MHEHTCNLFGTNFEDFTIAQRLGQTQNRLFNTLQIYDLSNHTKHCNFLSYTCSKLCNHPLLGGYDIWVWRLLASQGWYYTIRVSFNQSLYFIITIMTNNNIIVCIFTRTHIVRIPLRNLVHTLGFVFHWYYY